MPAGSKRFDWSPKETEKFEKTASTGVQAVEVDELLEAAKKVQAQFGGMEDLPCDGAPCDEAVGTDKASGTDVALDASPVSTLDESPAKGAVTDVAEAVQEVIEKAEKAEAVVKKVEEAVEKVEEAAQEVRNAVQDGTGNVDLPGDEVAEIEIEIEDENGASDEDKDEVKDEDEFTKESEDEPKEKTEKKASLADEFVRFANISPENRSKLTNYWVKYLGYPKDYVSLMVKDYEK
jgi:cytochrome c556